MWINLQLRGHPLPVGRVGRRWCYTHLPCNHCRLSPRWDMALHLWHEHHCPIPGTSLTSISDSDSNCSDALSSVEKPGNDTSSKKSFSDVMLRNYEFASLFTRHKPPPNSVMQDCATLDRSYVHSKVGEILVTQLISINKLSKTSHHYLARLAI